MPQFQMPKGDTPATFDKLASFVRGYLEAMFFTECHCDSEELGDKGFSDLAPVTLATIIGQCEAWQADNASLLGEAYSRDYDGEQAGRDYWYTRNGHGVGFWDRDELKDGELGQRLSDACRYKGQDLYLGDDGCLYVS